MPILSGRMSQLGTESAFEVLARANALQREGRNIINLGIGQPICIAATASRCRPSVCWSCLAARSRCSSPS